MFQRPFVASFALTMSVARLASAQVPAPPPAASPPASSSELDLNNTPAPPVKPVPDVDDPMLAGPPDAAKRIESWSDALSMVRARSPDYLGNLETIHRAEAQSRMALAALLPVVNGVGTYQHNFNQVTIPISNAITIVAPPSNVWSATASASWTPLNARALFDRETAQKAVDVAKLSFQDRRRQIASGMVGAMLAVLSSSRVADLNRVGLRAALERLHLTQARLQYGQGTPLDVDRANEDVAASRRLIVDGDESLRRAREALGVALGAKEPVAVATNLDLEGFEHAVATTCHLNDAIERRPDVVAARAKVELAKRAATSAELAPLPTLGVASAVGYTDSPLLAPNTTFMVEGVLTIPFYDGGYRYGQLRDARAVEAQATQSLEATRISAIMTSARTTRGVEVSRADRDVSKTERDLAARIDMRTREAYSRGRGTSLDLVISAQALRQAEINLAILEFQLAEARADAVLENAECAF
ncbi:MAG TPA: TolC family protein [Polyangiaceae bacterium]|jgi:outer membrane protein TolC